MKKALGRKFKVSIGLAVALIMVSSLVVTGCNVTNKKSTDAGNQTNESEAPVSTPSNSNAKKIRLAWTVAHQADHPYTVAAETFKKVVEEKSKGSIQVDLYPGGQLGGDADMFQAIQLGNIDVGVLSSPVIASQTKVLVGVDMPYIFNNDYDLLYKAQSGEPGKKLLKRLEEEVNLKALSFVYQPFRHFYTNKEIKSIADFKGLKLRSMQSPVHIEIYKALGATPTTLPYNEVYTAMQAGTIDGFESDVIGANASKFYEVSEYLTISGHFNNSIILAMAQKTWNGLSEDEKNAVEEASVESAKASLETTIKENDKYIKVMEEKGMKINEIDMTPILEAEKAVIEKFSKEIPEVDEFVRAVEAMKK